jgi:hypothetical protein
VEVVKTVSGRAVVPGVHAVKKDVAGRWEYERKLISRRYRGMTVFVPREESRTFMTTYTNVLHEALATRVAEWLELLVTDSLDDSNPDVHFSYRALSQLSEYLERTIVVFSGPDKTGLRVQSISPWGSGQASSDLFAAAIAVHDRMAESDDSLVHTYAMLDDIRLSHFRNHLEAQHCIIGLAKAAQIKLRAAVAKREADEQEAIARANTEAAELVAAVEDCTYAIAA